MPSLAAISDDDVRRSLAGARGQQTPSWLAGPRPLTLIRARLAAQAARRQVLTAPEFQVQAVRPGPAGEWSTCEGAWSIRVSAWQYALNLVRQTHAPARKGDPLAEVFIVQVTDSELIVLDVDERRELHREAR